jgi:hypothetical protein
MLNSLGVVKKFQTGDDVNTQCGRCKCEREHVIIALKPDGSIERVQCRTCESNHLYRAARPATARTRTAKDKSALPAETGPAKEYSMQARFSLGDRLIHSKFGTGIVTELRPGKIEVKFGREIRVLIHAG